jgi:hypothetical protein
MHSNCLQRLSTVCFIVFYACSTILASWVTLDGALSGDLPFRLSSELREPPTDSLFLHSNDVTDHRRRPDAICILGTNQEHVILLCSQIFHPILHPADIIGYIEPRLKRCILHQQFDSHIQRVTQTCPNSGLKYCRK